MRVFLMRHGDAGDKREWSGPDADRPLSELGIARTTATAEYFVRAGMRPSRILTSPYARAFQTAELVAKVLETPELVVVDDRLTPAFDVKAFREILAENVDEEMLLLVGHDPSFSAVIVRVMGGGSIALKKGAVLRLDLDDTRKPSGQLVWLASPTLFNC